MLALSWKIRATISNVASQPLAGMVEVAKAEAAIADVHEAGDVGEKAIKEEVDYDTKVSKRRSTA